MLKANQRLSDHLELHEVICKCGDCYGGVLRWEVIDLFERIRTRCSERLARDCPVQVNSGVRCRLHNIAVGGSSSSQHLLGHALDLKLPTGFGLEQFLGICLEENWNGGVGLYDTFVHIDTCTDPEGRRWRKTTT